MFTPLLLCISLINYQFIKVVSLYRLLYVCIRQAIGVSFHRLDQIPWISLREYTSNGVCQSVSLLHYHRTDHQIRRVCIVVLEWRSPKSWVLPWLEIWWRSGPFFAISPQMLGMAFPSHQPLMSSSKRMVRQRSMYRHRNHTNKDLIRSGNSPPKILIHAAVSAVGTLIASRPLHKSELTEINPP